MPHAAASWLRPPQLSAPPPAPLPGPPAARCPAAIRNPLWSLSLLPAPVGHRPPPARSTLPLPRQLICLFMSRVISHHRVTPRPFGPSSESCSDLHFRSCLREQSIPLLSLILSPPREADF